MAEHAHGPNLPEVAAASDDERARAEALWKASEANAERWRDPDAAAAAGFRFRGEDEAGPGRRVRFLHVPNPAWRADGRVLDPTRPETLVYWNGPGDRLTLVGVMYTAARAPPALPWAGRSPAGTTTSPAATPPPGPSWAGPLTASAPRARSTAAAAR